MKQKKISLTIALLCMSIFVFGQKIENNKVIHRSNELGMHAGFTTGLGISYRYWGGKAGVQVSALPLKIKDFQFMSGAVTGLLSLSNKKYTRFYLYLGNHVIYKTSDFEIKDDYDLIYNAGFGAGFEVGRKVRFNLMAGFGGYNLLDKKDYSLFPTIETGLYFKI